LRNKELLVKYLFFNGLDFWLSAVSRQPSGKTPPLPAVGTPASPAPVDRKGLGSELGSRFLASCLSRFGFRSSPLAPPRAFHVLAGGNLRFFGLRWKGTRIPLRTQFPSDGHESRACAFCRMYAADPQVLFYESILARRVKRICGGLEGCFAGRKRWSSAADQQIRKKRAAWGAAPWLSECNRPPIGASAGW